MNAQKWDLRFLEVAKLVSTWSKDPSTKVGAVIAREKKIVSLGFNGFPSQMRDEVSLYEDREKKYSRVVHGEINALIFAKGSVEGCTLYTTPFAPCDRCVVQMIQAGITRFVFPAPTEDALSRWAKAFELTKSYIEEAGLVWTEYVQDDETFTVFQRL